MAMVMDTNMDTDTDMSMDIMDMVAVCMGDGGRAAALIASVAATRSLSLGVVSRDDPERARLADALRRAAQHPHPRDKLAPVELVVAISVDLPSDTHCDRQRCASRGACG
eukprot:1128882-Prymnesium_polylepis.1